MAGIERKASTKAAKQICECRRANQTKEILYRAAACPNLSVLSYIKSGRKLWYPLSAVGFVLYWSS